MTSSLFTRLFPPPAFLVLPRLGLDISDRSIKFILLKEVAGHTKVALFGERAVPEGVIGGGHINQEPELVAVLASIHEATKVSYAAVSLPEEKAFIARMRLPPMKKQELASSVELQLEEYVPLKASEAVFDYEIISEPSPGQNFFDLAVSALPEASVASYSAALNQAGFQPLSFEIEAQAIARALLTPADQGTVMIVDLGRSRTGLSVATGNRVLFSSTIASIGGEQITKAIQKNLKVDYTEAENLKVTKGLSLGDDNQDLTSILVPIVSALKDEIKRAISYWESYDDGPGQKRAKIGKIILCGGQATMPGLTAYIGLDLGLPVEVGNAWANVTFGARAVPPIYFNDSLRYVTAIGLSLRVPACQ